VPKTFVPFAMPMTTVTTKMTRATRKSAVISVRLARCPFHVTSLQAATAL